MFVAGLNPTQTWASTETPPFSLGQLAAGYDGKMYRFVQADASGITGAGYVVAIETGNVGDMVETTVSTPGTSAGMPVGIAMGAVAASAYCWVCVYGSGVPVRVAASAAKGTLLNTTATAGQLDDDATAGAERIFGLALEAANGGAAGNANATITFPVIALTI